MSILIEKALKNATDTKACLIQDGAIKFVADVFKEQFPNIKNAIIIADPRTWKAAGINVDEILKSNGINTTKYIIEEGGKKFHAEYHYVVDVRNAIQDAVSKFESVIPVAVGSGVINDLTKLASGELHIPYMVVATAASVDGYSSFGASITSPEGAKQTYACPAPRAIIADLDVIRNSPREMTAWGYGDLLSKIPAGADWILAKELGVSEWHDRAWHTVQDGLPDALGNPEAIRDGDSKALEKFVEGLMLGGFAMQDMQSSRPASGAEHLFSHILDMQHHTYKGDLVSHGAQVGVATYFISKFYKKVLDFDYTKLDVESCVKVWPTWEEEEKICRDIFKDTMFPELGVIQTKPKFHYSKDALREHLEHAKNIWPQLKTKLEKQLLAPEEIKRRLSVVGAAIYPEDIGTTSKDMASNTLTAVHMRNRYNVLDFTYRTQQMLPFANEI
jgi:glycerol-1-phosphate dehydrogenase [NAD(P)+]